MISRDIIKETFGELVSIDSPSLKEKDMKNHIKAMFLKLGIELEEDASASITGSNSGNLYGYIRGNGNPPILLSAHMDTVMPGLGKKAVFHKNGKITSDGTTVLGADDVSGITAIYAALCLLRSRFAKHRDVELLFTTGEELYCKGAKAFDYRRVKSRNAVVLDLSGRIGDAAYAAPTILSIEAKIHGKSAHAGFCPEEGIHAIKACCEAVACLPQGHIDDVTTANIGLITGGDGINIVPRECVVKGEVRSLYHERAQAAAEQYRQIFMECTQKYCAELQWNQQLDIQAYETSRNSQVIRDYETACKHMHVTPNFVKSFGGSDNNVFAQNGIEGIVIATSMNNVHGFGEYANVDEIVKVSEILTEMLV
ncbi:MAG: M20/M25/M40 family metallo-hydrolase [Lachnospiraceae bacterium]|nr:M20/M25/M40 family metallo-hydrolase [Lachnospiraceae bacterium]MDE6750230.1 M20/M25/M40 family metallo-hydrolase [Lachnospiraceae bacterium]